MNLSNGIDLSIKRSYYNKTVVGEDGVTQTVDTEHQYPLFQLQIFKNYFNTSEEQLVSKIISDLKAVVEALENMEKEANKESER